MDVFGFAVSAGGDFLRAAAVDAAHELAIFDTLARGPATLDELADVARIAPRGNTRRTHRLRALLDVLVAIGAIARSPDGPAFTTAPTPPPPRPVVARAGWGLMAEVIRSDRPLHPEGGELERRYHLHLARAGAAAARELAPFFGTTSLVDLGGGAGTYTAAFLDAAPPSATAILVDFGDVLAIARHQLADFGGRVSYRDGDARAVDAGTGHGAALLANVLHLHSPAICAGLCAAAARAVASSSGPGGVVVVKDLRVDEDRSGPLEGLLFALNMAIYTGEGDVYPTSQLRAWLAAAGLAHIDEHRLAAAPDAVVLVARRGEPASG